jgi:ElaB/YqjD/DUF883 family membrane-anchored ribosome-binding protein
MVDDASEQTGAPNQANEAVDADVRASLAALRGDVERLTADLACLVQSQRSAAGSMIVGAIGEAKSQVSQAASGIESFASEVEADVRTRIRSKPLTSVLVAAAIGYSLRALEGSHRAH